MPSSYLIDTIYLLLAAVIVVPLAQVVRLGAVPGFVLAGVLIGPAGLGLIGNLTEIHHLAEIGVVFLMFFIGMQLKPARLWQMRRYVFGLGLAQVLVVGALLMVISGWFFDLSWEAALLIGAAMALSSTAFVLQILSSQRLMTTIYGRAAVSVLLLQDLAVVPLLALVQMMAAADTGVDTVPALAVLKSVALVVAVVVAGRYLLDPVLRRIAMTGLPEVFTASAVLLVLGVSLLTQSVGLSMAMGAFMAGLLMADSTYRHQVQAEIAPFRGLLLGLFFMTMGMALSIDALVAAPLLIAGGVLGLLVIKTIGMIPLALMFGMTPRNALAVSLLLAESGEFALVLLALAYQSDLLASGVYQQVLAIAIMSMLLTPVLAWLAQLLVPRGVASPPPEKIPDDAPVVVAGFGRVGRRIGDILTMAEQPYVALDANPGVVDRGRREGLPVFFGDVSKPEVLTSAGAANANVIILTLNDIEATEVLLSTLREQYPDKTIFVRGHSLSQCLTLRRLGASGAVSENVEASIELGRLVLSAQGLADTRSDAIVEKFRDRYRSQIEDATL
ncbi:MAG: monovalent cation:proton antiporter-2 (CPA2) family protein [Proteobacteria bacterium]|nr:monovalent cation:proton antiporter-2 (CPA2) family protein [Pseudomonadota bacterium]MDA1300115.1 monovalent cation:proton antiporter-2 (CPA2) family protein [Pseudomonadota bacterium]